MSKYHIVRACGHEEDIQIYGPAKLRQGRADWEADRLCRECWLAQREQERQAANQAAAEASADNGLPQLQGSEKQIAWAESLRAAILPAAAELLAMTEANFHKIDDLPAEKQAATREQFRRVCAAMRGLPDEATAHIWVDSGRDLAKDVATLPALLRHDLQAWVTGRQANTLFDRAEAREGE